MAQITITIEDDLKEAAEKVFNELGLDLANGIKLYLAQVVKEGGIPFPTETPEVSLEQ